MKIQKADIYSSAGTEIDNSTNVDVQHVSQPIAKPNVVRCFDFKVSKCCGKHGFVSKYDGIASGTNYYDSEKEGICPKCEKPSEFISQTYYNKKQKNEPIN